LLGFFFPVKISFCARFSFILHIITDTFSVFFLSLQGYVFSSHHSPVGGQGGRLLQEVCQKSQAEASTELVPVQISGQAHRAGAAASAERQVLFVVIWR